MWGQLKMLSHMWGRGGGGPLLHGLVINVKALTTILHPTSISHLFMQTRVLQVAGTLGVLLYSESCQVKVRVKVWYADSLDGIICLSLDVIVVCHIKFVCFSGYCVTKGTFVQCETMI